MHTLILEALSHTSKGIQVNEMKQFLNFYFQTFTCKQKIVIRLCFADASYTRTAMYDIVQVDHGEQDHSRTGDTSDHKETKEAVYIQVS